MVGQRALTGRGLNRALLARQMLLERVDVSPLDAVERLVAVQAQVVSPPHVGLWSRLVDYEREDLCSLLTGREVVRATFLRSTLHLTSSRDYLAFRRPLHPALTRSSAAIAGKRLSGLDLERLLQRARARFADGPCTFAELRDTLVEAEPERDPSALAYAVRTRLPLVQVPSGKAWGYAGNTPFTLAESWLGAPPDPAEEAHEMVRRYLAAFGPASVMDFQAWSGLTRMRETFEELRPELRTFEDENGKELFDLPDSPLPDEETPAPPRFVPDYDNLVLSHADRTRVIADEHKKSVFLPAARVKATILVDGFVAGTWKVEEKRREATLIVEPFGRLPEAARDTLAEEGERLIRFLKEGAKSHHVKFDGVR